MTNADNEREARRAASEAYSQQAHDDARMMLGGFGVFTSEREAVAARYLQQAFQRGWIAAKGQREVKAL